MKSMINTCVGQVGEEVEGRGGQMATGKARNTVCSNGPDPRFLSILQNLRHGISLDLIKNGLWDFPGGPVVKPSSSSVGGVVSIPDQEAKIPHVSGSKTKP